MALVELDHVAKSYWTAAGEVLILRDLALEVAASESVAIMGPSGSGKSTLMNILGCLDLPTAGCYRLDGRDVASLDPDQRAYLRNRALGFVFQGYNLLPRASLEDNVALPLLYAGLPAAARGARARELLGRVGLQGYEHYLPSSVSGGQQQRVAIARALANHPRLVLADEPTGNLDSRTSADIMDLFVALNAREGITLILVTHEPDIARYARRLIQMVDGRIVSDQATAAREPVPERATGATPSTA